MTKEVYDKIMDFREGARKSGYENGRNEARREYVEKLRRMEAHQNRMLRRVAERLTHA